MKVDDNSGVLLDINDLIENSEPLDYDDPYFNYRDQIRANHIRRTNHISDILESYKTQQGERERMRREQRSTVLKVVVGVNNCFADNCFDIGYMGVDEK